ncbi:MAG: hypothetical protein JSS38_03440 [Nitrospira sp.]|nr:hypothetical protein [Nitrospira sp.]
MMAKWRMKWGVVGFFLLLTGLPVVWAGSNESVDPEGPSLEETMAFIKDTWEACATMRSGLQRMAPKDGAPWQMDRTAKVDVEIRPPSSLQLITRLNERMRFGGALDLQSPVEKIQEFDLNAMSPNVSSEREGEGTNLYGIRLRCTRAACVTEWVATLSMPGKPVHDLKIGRLVVTNLEELVYEDRAPKDKPGEKKGELSLPVCDAAAAESLSKALSHAIVKAGGKKPLF